MNLVRAACCVIVPCALAACVDAYPQRSYLADVHNDQRSLREGVLRFRIDPEWMAWRGRHAGRVHGIQMLARVGTCEGTAGDAPLPYRIERRANEVIVRFGSGDEIVCRIGSDMASLQVMLHAYIPERPLFDPGEAAGMTDRVEIFLKPVVR
jgi:hypothetical protein